MDYTALIIGVVIGAIVLFLIMMLRKKELPLEVKAKLSALESQNELLTQSSVSLDKEKGMIEVRLENAEKVFAQQK